MLPVRDGEKHSATLTYTSGNEMPAAVALIVGKKKTIANGTLSANRICRRPANGSQKLDFATPAWAHTKAMTEETTHHAQPASTMYRFRASRRRNVRMCANKQTDTACYVVSPNICISCRQEPDAYQN